MHTLKVKFSDNEVAYLHHNSDWSGDVIVCIPGRQDVSLPGALVLKLGEAAIAEVKDRIIRFIEGL